MPTSEIAVQSNIWENNSVLQEKRDNTKSQGYMPFLFRSKRQFPDDKHQIPPVGAYNVPGVFDNLTKSAIANQPQILKEQFQRKNQMCIFKSNQQRFSHNRNDIPGPASYNYMNNNSATKFKPLNYKLESSKQKLQLIKKSPTCPAIPDSKVRYGYTKDTTGNFKLIEKTQTQVLKEKQKLKEYFSTLVGQNHYSRISRVKQSDSASKNNLNPHKIITKLEKYVDKRNSLINSSSKNSRDKKSVRPKIKLSHDIQPVRQSNDHLGPGCYNVSLDTVKKGQQKENFQFFSSSEIRFAALKKEQDVNPYEHIFKENKNMKARPNLPGKIYKKSFPTYVDPKYFEKIQNPGPGYYEPEVEKVKKSNGNVRFGYESRFKQRQAFTNESTHEVVPNNEESVKWGNLRKQKIQSPHRQYEPVKESQIYGIMNEQISDSNIHGKNFKMKSITNKQSAVFLDKSQRFNICQKTYYNRQNDLEEKEETKKLWETKGSFMSKLTKKSEVMKENTPGPGAYGGEKLRKKTFNIKNY